MSRTILHMDMDAFYASVEQADDPGLKDLPVIVGGTSSRGVVSAASYEARKYGVHSAMPIFQARKKCPQGIFVPVRMTRYKEVSNRIMEILRGFSPLVEQVSIDEAFMDLSGTERLLGTPCEVGLRIKQKIKAETSLTCSIGIAPSRFLAKIASDMEKPDGFFVVSSHEVSEFINRLPIQKVSGIGRKTEKILNELGITRLGDVHRVSKSMLLKRTGKFGKRILDLSQGIDNTPINDKIDSKSISSENTLANDTNNTRILKKLLMVQSETVGRRLREKNKTGSTITLKMKTSDFKTITRSLTIEKPTSSSQTIYKTGLDLLAMMDMSRKYRLIGIGISNLQVPVKYAKQMSLFMNEDSEDSTWEKAERAMDEIKKKFGKEYIKKGGML